ncbi:MAG: aspartate/glutamate racemase family protein [Solirubrobacterales bacterium]
MKIGVVQNVSDRILDKVGYLKLQRNNLRHTLGDDVELAFEGSRNDDDENYMDVMFNPFLSALDGRVMLEKLYLLQEQGCDAVVIACSMDPFLEEARSILRVPIVGTIEAAMFTACMAGPKFSFLVHRDRRCAEATEEAVVRYGLRSRMTPMVYASERLAELMLEAYSEPEIVRDEVLAGCAEVIQQGAHSVIIGGIGLANLVTACRISEVPGYGAPVLDPISVAVHMLRYRVGLQRSLGIPPTSQAGSYRRLPKKRERATLASFGFAQQV